MIPLTLDSETALIRPGKQSPDLACIAVQSRGLGVRELFHWTNVRELLEWALTRPDILIVGHSVAFDMAVFGANDPSLLPVIFDAYNANRITDTEIRAKLLDIAAGSRRFHENEDDKVHRSTYSLESLSLRHLGRVLEKETWRLRYGELIPLPLFQWPQGAVEYPLEDVRATEDIFTIQDQSPELLIDQFRQARAAFWIKLMTGWGIRTDAHGIKVLADKTRLEYDALADDLRGLGLLGNDRTVRRRSGVIETQPGSRDTKAAGRRIVQAYQAQGKDFPRTKTGQACLDEQACIDSGDPALIKYAKLTSLRTVMGKDLPALEGGVHRPIHSRFESLLETGRTSSSGNAQTGGMNIQNIRRLPGIRECFTPRCLTCGRVLGPGDVQAGRCLGCGSCLTVYAVSDYGGVELCSWAQVCIKLVGWSMLAQALNAGLDPHLMIAEDLLDRPYAELNVIKEAGTGDDCIAGKGPAECPCAYCVVDQARQVSKVGNFGFQGGMGAPTLVEFALANYGLRITEDRARTLKKIWQRRWPEQADYFRIINAHVRQAQPRIQQLFSQRWRGGVNYTEAANTLFQGLAADMAKDAGWNLAQACYLWQVQSWLCGCRTVNFVHDDFTVEVPEARGHEAAFALRDIMLTAARVWLPDVKVDCKPVLMRRWSRKAKQVWADGRLVPWG